MFNFRMTSPSRITRNTVEALAAEVAKHENTPVALDSNMAQRVALFNAEKITLANGAAYYAQKDQLTEYMSVREMYWFLKGMLAVM